MQIDPKTGKISQNGATTALNQGLAGGADTVELEKVVLSLGDFEGELAMMVTDDRIKQIEEELKLPNDAGNRQEPSKILGSRFRPVSKGKKKKALTSRFLKRSTGRRMNQEMRD